MASKKTLKLLQEQIKLNEKIIKLMEDREKKEEEGYKSEKKRYDSSRKNLSGIAKEAKNLSGQLEKVKKKDPLKVEEAQKYQDKMADIRSQVIRLHGTMKKGKNITADQVKEVKRLEKEYKNAQKQAKELEKNAQSWEDSAERSGPVFLQNFAKFKKAAKAGTTPIDDYGRLISKAGDKLGKMPGLFKMAGGAAKKMGGAIGRISKSMMGWPMLIAGAIKAAIDITRAADQLVKDANKAFATVRGPDIMTGDLQKQFKDFNDQIYNMGENIRVGLDVTQIREFMSAMYQAGASITQMNQGLMTYRDAIYVASKASKTLSMDLPQIGDMMGKMMMDMRMDIDQVDKAFVQVAFDAKKSGLSTDRFWTTVQNASASLALYGVVVKTASQTVKAFTENMVGGADDAAEATDNMFEVFKTGGLKAQMAIIQFAEQGGADVPKIFEEMAKEAAGKIKTVEGEIKFIEGKKKKSAEDVEQLKKLRAELYAAQSKENRMKAAADGGIAAQAAEAGALAKRAPEMIISAIKGQVGGPLHKLEGHSLLTAIQGAKSIGMSEKTVRMLVEISKVTEQRMEDLANRSTSFWKLSGKENKVTRDKISGAITEVTSSTGKEQIKAADNLKALLQNKLGMMPTMADDVVKLIKSDEESGKEIVKHLNAGNTNIATQISGVLKSDRAIEKMSGAHFKDQEKTEDKMAKAAEKTHDGIVKQTLSYNEMVKIAKDDIQYRLASMKMFSTINSGVWNILDAVVGNKKFLTREQRANMEMLRSRGIQIALDKDGNIKLDDLGKQIRENTVKAEGMKAELKEQKSLMTAMEKIEEKGQDPAKVLGKEFERVTSEIALLTKKKDKGKISEAENLQLKALEDTKGKLEQLGADQFASAQQIVAALGEGTVDEAVKNLTANIDKSFADASELLKKKEAKDVTKEEKGKIDTQLAAIYQSIDRQTKVRTKLEKQKKLGKDEKAILKQQEKNAEDAKKALEKTLPDMLSEQKETYKKNSDQLTQLEDSNKKLASLDSSASQTSELQKQMLLSTEEGRKRVAKVLKGKADDEVFQAAKGMGFEAYELKDLYKGLAASEDEETRQLAYDKERVVDLVEKGYIEEKHEEAYKGPTDRPAVSKNDDFFDIVKGGFVNVSAGDVVVDKDSLAEGMGGPPGAGLPEVKATTPAGGAPQAPAQTINIQVDATEKDLASKIANQIKKELYNRSIATSSYSLS